MELGIPVQTLTTGLPVDQMPTDEDGVVAGPSWQQVCAMGYEIAGVGVIPGDVVAGICARFGTRVRRVLLDEATGTTAETGVDRLPATGGAAPVRDHPGRALPGTGLRPGGPVLRSGPRHRVAGRPDEGRNLLTLCRRHHRMKHQTRWRVVMTRDGVCTWTDPFGQEYTTRPVDRFQLAA